MKRALLDARVDSSRVDYVNAHATGTPVGDVAEAHAISRVCPQALVSSVKGAIGHTIAAAGAIEAATCIAALQGGWVPGTAGLREPDPGCPVRLLRRPVQRELGIVVSNSFGFGGQNCSLVFGSAQRRYRVA
jgi:3-oxoacyl-(acyl-carrier-protein) synthase